MEDTINRTKLTKSELIEENERLQDKIKEQSFLAQTVKSKDAEIVNLQKVQQEHATTLTELKQKHALEIEALTQKLSEIPEIDRIKEYVGILEKENKRLVDMCNNYRNSHRSFLKSIQGSTEIAIDLEELMYQKLIKRGE